MRVVTIGDIHGHDTWKNAVYRINEDTGEIMYCYIDNIYDKVVFVGDYVDDWNLPNIDILHNLHEIINFKKQYPDNVVLLWGNHDVAYLRNEKVSGFRPEMAPDLYYIFQENRELFQLAYQYKNVIWTHAGIHSGWWQYYVQPVINREKITRFTDFLGESDTIAGYLNLMYEFNYEPIFMCSHHRGGHDKVGGPLWADKIEIYTKPLPGYHQIVGHNPVSGIKTYDFYDLTKVTFVDCMAVCDKFYKIDL